MSLLHPPLKVVGIGREISGVTVPCTLPGALWTLLSSIGLSQFRRVISVNIWSGSCVREAGFRLALQGCTTE